MEKIGTKRNSKKQQRANAELETIIEEFGRAMRNAHPATISYWHKCTPGPRFTGNMDYAWLKYVDFCEKISRG